MSSETSTKPYLIRALHEWCMDNGYTPYVVVHVDGNTRVPMAHVRDGQITLNIGTLATHKLELGNEFIEFQARFGGVTEYIAVPIGAVSAIYARETGAGMGFEVQPYVESESDSDTPSEGVVPDSHQAADTASDLPSPDGDEPPPSRPRLTVVK